MCSSFTKFKRKECFRKPSVLQVKSGIPHRFGIVMVFVHIHGYASERR
jgi:hypothetical protein